MEKMVSQERPEVTTRMLLKVAGLGFSIAVGFVAFYGAFHGQFDGMLLIDIALCILLELSCSTCLLLTSRHLRGVLCEEPQLNSIKRSLRLGWVILVLSVIGGLFLVITGIAKFDEIRYKDGDLFAALTPCLLAVFWSAVLINDAKFYRKTFTRMSAVNIFSIHQPFDIQNAEDLQKPIKNYFPSPALPI